MSKIGIGAFSGVLTFSFLLLALLTPSFVYAEFTPPLPGAPNYINIDVEKAHQMLEESPAEVIILLDVRTEEEYSIENIPGAINIPLPDLESMIGELDESKVIIVYCKTGDISREASEKLVRHGFGLVYNMVGGIETWKEKFATSTSTPMPAQTPTLPPAVTLTPSPAVSPASTPLASPLVTPTSAPVQTPTGVETPEEEERQIPGFEVSLAILILLILFMLLKRR